MSVDLDKLRDGECPNLECENTNLIELESPQVCEGQSILIAKFYCEDCTKTFSVLYEAFDVTEIEEIEDEPALTAGDDYADHCKQGEYY